ncbi:MAG: 50S ribosomal protein L10 [Candidatus Nanopelagicales bacterium]|nr:50S ribosomal protein L10 [Candidatus Nanopelagicales bacterium]MDP4824599.1 50S ribosomal protein L10 [Candidatus Nanopelagicales bacterium]MDP4888306.1 50S ribosomal protein L10 [Candidatus Nanopelagicales bacterium]
MARDDKITTVAEITEEFRSSTATVLTEYRGLSVAQLKALRRSLADIASYTVVKNTLTKRAAQEAGVEGLDELFVGPNAIAFIKGDVVTAAKGLRDFAKDNPGLVIKGGYMDGRVLDAAEIAKLADLESREVLLAKLAGAMKASMGQAASVFVAPLSQAARLFAALQETLPAEAATTTAVDTPSTEQAADEEPVPAVEAAEQNPEAVADGSTEG